MDLYDFHDFRYSHMDFYDFHDFRYTLIDFFDFYDCFDSHRVFNVVHDFRNCQVDL